MLSIRNGTTITRSFSRGMAIATNKEVLFNVLGSARTVTLNRPSKLNALTSQMCKDITPRLVEFGKSNAANLIIIKSDSERAFCSGGDVVSCAKNNTLGFKGQSKSAEFFQNEYSLNYLLSTYNKPVVAIANGIVMGGGVGLSVHNPFRIVTETTRFAMPESSIGFINDVGTSFWLPRLDGNIGIYLGLTGEELNGFDTLLAGFGTHYVPTSRLADLVDRLSSLNLTSLSTSSNGSTFFNPNSNKELYPIINAAIEEFTQEIPKSHKFKFSSSELNTIENCFSSEHKTVESIIKSLEKDGSEFALATIGKLRSQSPLSVKLNLALLNRSRESTIHEAFTRELKLAGKLMTLPSDFTSFVTSKLINKSSNISSMYDTIESVPESKIEELVSLDFYTDDSSLTNQVELINKLKINSFENQFIKDFNSYPHKMGLPTQSEIESFIKQGEFNYSQVVNSFRDKYDDKSGVKAKVKLVLDRKCKSSVDGTLSWI